MSQTKHWRREAIAAISDWPRLFHNANLSSGTAKNCAVCLGLKAEQIPAAFPSHYLLREKLLLIFLMVHHGL